MGAPAPTAPEGLDAGGGGHETGMPNERRDEVLSALDVLTDAIERNSGDERLLLSRLSSLRRARAEGAPLSEALAKEPAPGTLQLLGRILSRLTDGSGSARRALARALRADGATIPAIAQVFGVTHQRVSNILSHPTMPAPVLREADSTSDEGLEAAGSDPSHRQGNQERLG
jgi:hypothetical protein